MKVVALRHKDVRQQEKFYLQFNTKTQEYIMNVGEKTFLQVSAMQEEEIGEALGKAGEKLKEEKK